MTTQLNQLIIKYKIKPLVANQPRPVDVVLTIPQSTIDMINHDFFSPIVPVFTSNPRDLARFLYSNGLLVRPIGTPTVPSGREQVRICIHANNSTHQVDSLVKNIDLWIAAHLLKSHI